MKIPTTKLRLYTEISKITAKMVEDYRSNHSCTMQQAKEILINESDTVLQQYFINIFTLRGEWLNVPSITEMRK